MPQESAVDSTAEDELTQFNIRARKSSVRAFKRLADRQGKTVGQWAVDELLAAVTRNVDDLRKSMEEAAELARQQMEADQALLAEIEHEAELRASERSIPVPAAVAGRSQVPT